MKFILSLVAMAGAVCAYANEPLLVKVSGNGTVAPDWKERATCEVYVDKVVVTYQSGSTSSVVTFGNTLSKNVVKLIDDASKETPDVAPGPVGGPTTTWSGYTEEYGVRTKVTLKASGGHNATNKSNAARILVGLLDLVCK